MPNAPIRQLTIPDSTNAHLDALARSFMPTPATRSAIVQFLIEQAYLEMQRRSTK